MQWKRTLAIFLVNILCIISLSLPILLLNMYAKPLVRGFDPSDVSISLSYKPSTIGGTTAISLAAVIVIVLVAIVEFIFCWKMTKIVQSVSGQENFNWSLFWRYFWGNFLRIILIFGTCLALTGLVTDVIKLMVARPRPAFLHMCEPNYTVIAMCNSCGSKENPGETWPLCPHCPYLDADKSYEVCKKEEDQWFKDGYTTFFHSIIQ